MINFTDLTFSYPLSPGHVSPGLTLSTHSSEEATAIPLFAGLSLQIAAGEFVLLVGTSGVGKSTLLRMINGLVPHFSGGRLTGNLRVHGLDPVAATPHLMSQHVGFVFQDPEAQFVMDRVEDELAFALEQRALPPEVMRVRVEETLDLLNLAPLRDRPLTSLSGGEQQRVAIGAALALRPAILVLDEPTSQLDPQSAEDLLATLLRLNTDLGLTIVLAEHRLERVLPYVDRLLYLEATPPASPSEQAETQRGSVIVREGTPREILPQLALAPPLIQLGKALGWSPLPLTIKEGLRFSRQIALPSQVRTERAKNTTASATPVLTARGLSIAYQAQEVVNAVDLTVNKGEIVVLLGRNGAGKSSLLKSLVGLVRPRRGTITLAGEEITNQPVATICRTVGYLPQDPNLLLFADSVEEEIEITLRNHGLQQDPSARETEESMLAELSLTEHLARYPRDLSVGERQRVALAAIMVTQPLILLLDEPTRGLDYLAKAKLMQLLQTNAHKGRSSLIVTHDVEFAAAVADRVILMSQGEVIAEGSAATLLATSPLFASQVARLFPQSGLQTVHELLAVLQNTS